MKFLSELSYETYWKLCGINKDNTIGEKNKTYVTKKYIELYTNVMGDNHNIDFCPASWHWYYFRSDFMSPSTKSSINLYDTKHRLYLSINYDQLMNITTEFINKLESLQQPYDFKIKTCLPSGRIIENDSMVIYVDNEERLTLYVNILNEIIEKNPKFKEAIHKPSAHLGIINGRIGYGREFEPTVNSYSQVISEIGNKATSIAIREVRAKNNLQADFSREKMLEIIQKKRTSMSCWNIYKNFWESFWRNFYRLLMEKGYNIDKSFCVGERASTKTKLNQR